MGSVGVPAFPRLTVTNNPIGDPSTGGASSWPPLTCEAKVVYKSADRRGAEVGNTAGLRRSKKLQIVYKFGRFRRSLNLSTRIVFSETLRRRAASAVETPAR